MWEKASQKGREMIAQELSSQLPLLTSNNVGRFIAQNLCLSTYKRSKEEWRLHLKNQEKQKILAKEFLSELSSKKRQNEENETPATKKMKTDNQDNLENVPSFVIDKDGVPSNVEHLDGSLQDGNIKKKVKKKKEKVKSYLDDL
jgi:uncharacterized protein with von Willebrand factor type A (vWA) domain